MFLTRLTLELFNFNFGRTTFSSDMFPRKRFFKELEHFSYQKTFLMKNFMNMSLIFIIERANVTLI